MAVVGGVAVKKLSLNEDISIIKASMYKALTKEIDKTDFGKHKIIKGLLKIFITTLSSEIDPKE
jgi:hypothetical protein